MHESTNSAKNIKNRQKLWMKLLPDANLHKNLIGRGLGTSKTILHCHLHSLKALLPCGSERAHMRVRSALGVMAYLDTP